MGVLKRKIFVIEAVVTLLCISITSGNVIGNNDVNNKNGIQKTNANGLLKTEYNENFTQISDEEINDNLSNNKYCNNEYCAKNITIFSNFIARNINISEWRNRTLEKIRENVASFGSNFFLIMFCVCFVITIVSFIAAFNLPKAFFIPCIELGCAFGIFGMLFFIFWLLTKIIL